MIEAWNSQVTRDMKGSCDLSFLENLQVLLNFVAAT